MTRYQAFDYPVPSSDRFATDETYGTWGIFRVFLKLDQRMDDIMETAEKVEESGNERRLARLGRNLFRLVKRKMKKSEGWRPTEDMVALMENAEVDWDTYMDEQKAKAQQEQQVVQAGAQRQQRAIQASAQTQQQAIQAAVQAALKEERGKKKGNDEMGALDVAVYAGVREVMGSWAAALPHAGASEAIYEHRYSWR